MKLSREQLEQVVAYRDTWRAIGLQTEPVDRESVEPVLAQMYRAIKLPPVPLVILSSPASAMLAMPILARTFQQKAQGSFKGQLRSQLWGQLESQLKGQLRSQLWGQLWSQLWGQLESQLWGQLEGQLRDQLRGQLWDQLRDQLRGQLWGQLRGQLRDQLESQLRGQLESQLKGQLWSQLRDQLRDQLWSQLEGQLRDQLRDQLWSQLRDQFWGQLESQLWDPYAFGGHCEAYWIAFYRFCEYLGYRYQPQDQERLGWWETMARGCGWWWPYRQVVIAADRPIFTRWNAQHRLHAESGPAIEFRDGYKLWALNGVRVPEALVTQAAHDLDPQEWVVKQLNTEIRREAVRKIGIERVCTLLGATVLDRQNEYELLSLQLEDKRRRPYLKMRNPSLGIYHIEGVLPTITTVKEALTWRNGTERRPEVLT